MKKYLPLLCICLLGWHVSEAQKQWSAKDKAFLIENLTNTKQELLNEIQDLDPVQFAYKPDSTSWSIAEVVEHLAVYEEYLYWDLFYGQFTPERPELAAKVKDNDEQFLGYATDKTKGSSPWLALPIGRFQQKKDLISYFVRFRDEVIEYVNTTDCDFRVHFTYRAPGGGIWTERDLHQHTLIWIAHTTRHTDQIRKIKTSQGFPEAGNQKIWTEEDRAFLVENLRRTRQEMIAETKNLSMDQWHFNPSGDAWNIAQVVEHMGLFERIVLQEARIANNFDPQPEYHYLARSDVSYLDWMAEEQPHKAPKQATPLGLMKGKDNITFFQFGRDLLVDYIKSTNRDLKAHFTPRKSEPNRRRSIHSLMVVHFGHTDRHLRQIARIKAHPDYPKK